MQELLYHKMEWMQDQVHMKWSQSGPNDEEDFKDIFEGVKNQEWKFLTCIEDNYINQTKNYGICGYQKDCLDSNRK